MSDVVKKDELKSCVKEGCECISEDKVVNVTLDCLFPDKYATKGMWLNTGKKNESVHIYVNNNGVVLGYNSSDLDKIGASKIALVFEKDGNVSLQFFTENKMGGVKFVKVNKDMIYNKLFDLLKDLESKALKLVATPEVK